MTRLLLSVFFSILISCAFAQMNPKAMRWLHEPMKWTVTNRQLVVTAEPKTDFWRTTFYGYITDNGHFYYQEGEGDFDVQVKITGSFKELYDQAGLMIRLDSSNWIKSGVEFVQGHINISSVFTREFSDWSVISLSNTPVSIWLKLARHNDSIELSYSLTGKEFTLQRLGYFPPRVKAQIGLMTAAPEGTGFTVTFEDFQFRKL